jgi:hypothetical protein
MREVRLGPDGKPVEQPPIMTGCCLLCQGPLVGAELPPPRMVAAPDTAVAEMVRQLLFHSPPSTHRSRAPPAS